MSNLIQPLPIYNDINDSYFANDCDYHNKTIVSPITHLPSFILKRTTSLDNNFTFEQMNEDGTVCTSFTISTTPCISTIQEDSILYDLVTFDFPITNVNLCCGYKYIKITNGLNVWFTEYIRFKDFDANNSEHVKIEFRNSCNIQGLEIPFKNCNDFMFRFYLDELTGECCPTRTLEVEVETNESFSNIELSSVYNKRYNIKSFYLPHFLIDSLYSMAGFDEIYIYPKNTNISTYESGLVKEVSIAKLDEDGKCCFEQIEISFKREDNVVSSGCCENIGELECITFSSPYTNIVDAGSLPNQFIGLGVVYFINSNTGNVTNAWSNNVGDVATWDGANWGFSTPTEQYIVLNGVNYELINGVYEPTPYFTITNTSLGGQGIVNSNIPYGYFGKIELIQTGNPINDIGDFTQSELSSGVTFQAGALSLDVRLTIFNYNCDSLSRTITHTF